MSYQIQAKSDFSTGATLVVRIPESELDKKALYTVLADKPSFVLPFRFKTVDGDVEFTYLVGAQNKLQYSYGSRNTREYATLWASVLNPLLECNDWFMNPFSFVLQTEYLYYDKNSGAISYVYIPSIREYSDTDTLKQMATELAEKCPANDSELEIKALRAIMQGFSPKDFLQMLKTYQKPDVAPVTSSTAKYEKPQEFVSSPVPETPKKPANAQPAKREPVAASPQPMSRAADDIVINLHGGKDDKKKPTGKEKPRGSGLFGGKSDKKQPVEQPSEPQKTKGGLFGKKKPDAQPMIMGAAAAEQPQSQVQPQNYNAFQPTNPHTDADDEVTQFEGDGATQLEGASAKFRLVSSAPLPPEILINGNLGRPFIIGRFDISVGRQQADFEFDKSTKAISRRHAAIERSANGYSIVDLSSSAGTFINGQRVPPNVPHELTFGTRVSFGTSGADYVWEG
jgi:hypothetical protein